MDKYRIKDMNKNTLRLALQHLEFVAPAIKQLWRR
jgi:hypothetical protein